MDVLTRIKQWYNLIMQQAKNFLTVKTYQELTKRKIVRQDFVDNQIFELINNLLPSSKQREWNIELIASIRDFTYKF